MSSEFANLDRWPKSPERLAAELEELRQLRTWSTPELLDELERCNLALARLGIPALVTVEEARYAVCHTDIFENPDTDLAGLVGTTQDILRRHSAHYS